MQGDEIKPKGIYQLNDGRSVRVVTIYGDMARCDVFDTKSHKWVFLDHSLPIWIFKEKCPGPLSAQR